MVRYLPDLEQGIPLLHLIRVSSFPRDRPTMHLCSEHDSVSKLIFDMVQLYDCLRTRRQ
ncbi:hypothetical protein NEOLEDRAFT_1142703 [Neolentinus lepideus HHB14362 ss-1]|uniref:Uncharacterized protein n=1 Tax=Neolentinus lepideus HHB14362 ss-1 TaxID=1314782 RepID=A0A165MZT6_9AGAM|nr:hypothetical protein NEOLEDRAFT_1142703 [Neolentinus lepideus HHB14362 ss-1]